MKPRVLFVGRTRYRVPLNGSLARKFDALEHELDIRVLASTDARANGADERFVLMRPFPLNQLDGVVFWLTLPVRVAREVRRFHPHGISAQSAYEAAAALAGCALARRRVPIVVDVHGDWRTATRLYGSRLRGLLAPIGDRLAIAALRRSDALRTVSGYTSALVERAGLERSSTFAAYHDLEPFLECPVQPLPEQPLALFVGVLEPYKNVDGLVAAWRIAAPRVPQARLHVVGRGSRARLVEALVADLPGQTSWTPALSAEGVAAALDESTVLVLPSRSEGMGRVVIEAFCRRRPVVGSRVGGIPELVSDGENGLLIDPDDTVGLADALVRVLSDPALARRLAEKVEPVPTPTASDYAAEVRASIEQAADLRAP